MLPESCFGIDIVNGEWLIVVRRENGKNFLQRRFENTADGLTSLLKAIRDRAVKPKVCIKSAGRAALNLSLHLCSIPSAQVMLISDHGLQHMRTTRVKAGRGVTAEVLARYAECMI
jgi:hypothetical protein